MNYPTYASQAKIFLLFILTFSLQAQDTVTPSAVCDEHTIVVLDNTGNAYVNATTFDDGSTDTSWEVIQNLHKQNSNVKGIKFRRNYGKSAALNVGFQQAKGDVVITMDADLQDSPDEIPDLYKMIMDENYDLVSGWKKKRHDPLNKTIPTKLYNAVTRAIKPSKLLIMGCVFTILVS